MRSRPRFSKYAEDGKEMDKDLYRTCTAIVLLIKPFVWRRSRCRCRCRRGFVNSLISKTLRSLFNSIRFVCATVSLNRLVNVSSTTIREKTLATTDSDTRHNLILLCPLPYFIKFKITNQHPRQFFIPTKTRLVSISCSALANKARLLT